MRLFLLLQFLLFVSQPTLNAQYQEYAKKVVQILASDSLAGRGYVHDGDKKAAQFIQSEFQKFGVTPVLESYFQSFVIPVNTFPDSIFLSINDQAFKVGVDYHIMPGSPSISGTFDIVYLSAEELFDQELFIGKVRQSIGKALVIEEPLDSEMDNEKRDVWKQIEQFLMRHPNNPAAITVILTEDKLTWFGSQFEDPTPTIRFKKDRFPSDRAKITIELQNQFISDYQTQNVVGKIDGVNEDSTIVIMAHYDHFGMMGQAIFPGANDNASGVAMLLSLAKYYSEVKPAYTLIFAAFGAEELGLIGSKFFVENPPIDLSVIKFILNFDIAGTGDDGIQVVNGSVYREEFERLVELNSEYNLLPNVKIRGAACNSDHCNFDHLNIPSFYMYTLGGIQAYHDIYDRAETLPLTEFQDYHTFITKFIESLD